MATNSPWPYLTSCQPPTVEPSALPTVIAVQVTPSRLYAPELEFVATATNLLLPQAILLHALAAGNVRVVHATPFVLVAPTVVPVRNATNSPRP